MATAWGRCAAALREALLGESLWLFVFAWAALGCFVNTRDQVTWNLQHAWVESLAERGTLYVDGSATPRFALERVGDTWAAPDGHFYPNSAPGNYLAAAAVYFVLQRVFGLSYRSDYDLAGTLVVFFTTTLAAAFLFVLLYRIARHASGSRRGGLLVAAAFSFGTHAFPYSGVPYQHLGAAFFFVAAFALAYRRRHCGSEPGPDPALEGLLLGLGITSSFAFVPMGTAIAAYCLFPLERRRLAWLAAGAFVGLLPLLTINALHFGGPLTTVYAHSRDPNLTSYHLSWEAIAWRARFYLSEPTTGARSPCDIRRDRVVLHGRDPRGRHPGRPLRARLCAHPGLWVRPGPGGAPAAPSAGGPGSLRGGQRPRVAGPEPLRGRRGRLLGLRDRALWTPRPGRGHLHVRSPGGQEPALPPGGRVGPLSPGAIRGAHGGCGTGGSHSGSRPPTTRLASSPAASAWVPPTPLISPSVSSSTVEG